MNEKIYYRAWFIWLFLTSIYIAGPMLVRMLLPNLILNPSYSLINTIEKPFLFIGLFVPYGFWNTITAVSSLVGITTFIVATGIILSWDMISEKLKISGRRKIIVTLLILLLVTACVDFVYYGRWASLDLALGIYSLDAIGLVGRIK